MILYEKYLKNKKKKNAFGRRMTIFLLLSIMLVGMFSNVTEARQGININRYSGDKTLRFTTIDSDCFMLLVTLVNYKMGFIENGYKDSKRCVYNDRYCWAQYNLAGAEETPASWNVMPTAYYSNSVNGELFQQFTWKYAAYIGEPCVGSSSQSSDYPCIFQKNISPKIYAKMSINFYYPDAAVKCMDGDYLSARLDYYK